MIQQSKKMHFLKLAALFTEGWVFSLWDTVLFVKQIVF